MYFNFDVYLKNLSTVFCIMVSFCILVRRHEHMVSFLYIYFQTSLLISKNRASVFLFMMFMYPFSEK
jgi:hypothetical protein